MAEEHSSPIQNWKQLVIVVVLAFVIPIVVITLITQLVTGHRQGPAEEDAGIANRLRPVGEVVIGQADAQAGQRTGEQVFAAVCKTCHEAGLAGAPKFGDKAAWAHVISEGEKVAVEHAIRGFKGMPPKGGNPDLTDDEVHRGVAYMANAVGANWKAPAAGASTANTAAPLGQAAAASATPASTAASAPPTSTTTPVVVAQGGPSGAPPAAATAAKPDGKKVYETTCNVCHGAGLAGAPKFGDKGAWAPRIAQGLPTLYTNAINGKNAMPPKGGNPAWSDADVKAAVDYMVSAAR